jgi:flagellar basal body rod protein FlgG
MFLNPALSVALDRITDRAADVRRAFTPGAVPQNDDVTTARATSEFTLDPLAVCAGDGVYFITQDEHGAIAYTQDGSFELRKGRLVDSAGRAICGFSTSDRRPAPISIDPVDEAMERAADPHIDRDGRLVYERVAVDPLTGARQPQPVVVARIALARFPAGTRISTTDGSHSVAPPGVSPRLGVAGEAEFAPLETMRRARSRVDIDESLARLKEAYLAFDALQAAETAKGHLGKTVIDLVK